jgi:hypothetical protein
MIYETLKELIDNQGKQDVSVSINQDKELTDYQTTKRKEPSIIYLDENDGKIKEKPLTESKLDSSASAYVNYRTMEYNYKNPLKFIHDSIFGSLQL